MATDPSISLQIRPPVPVDTLGNYLKAASLHSLISERQTQEELRRQQTMEAQVKLQQQRQLMADQAVHLAAEQDPANASPSGGIDLDKTEAALKGKVSAPYFAELQKGNTAHKIALAGLQKDQVETAQRNADLIGSGANALLDLPDDQIQVQYPRFTADLAQRGVAQDLPAIDAFGNDPGKLRQFLKLKAKAAMTVKDSSANELATREQANKDAAEGRAVAKAPFEQTSAEAGATKSATEATESQLKLAAQTVPDNPDDYPAWYAQQPPAVKAKIAPGFSEAGVGFIKRLGVPVEKQPEYNIQTATAEAMAKMKPEDWRAQAAAVSGGNKKLEDRTNALVASAVARGDFKAAQAAIKDAADQIGRTETALATAKATEPIKINLAASQALARSDAAGLTDDDYSRAGEQYARTGTMPALGRDSVTRGKIVKAANAWAKDNGFSPSDITQIQASYAGDKKSLENFQKQRDQVVSFEQTAQKNLGQFLDLASKIPDTGVPWLNRPLRSLDANLVGDENMAAINAARQVANNEIAKVTSGGGMSAALSDSARHEVENYNPMSATFAQTKAVAKILQQDMANRRQSMDATLSDIKSRIGNAGTSRVTPDVTPAAAHRIRIGNKFYDYKGSGATDDLKNYTEVKP